MIQTCRCIQHDGFHNTYIDANHKLVCRLCGLFVPGWETLYVEVDSDTEEVREAAPPF